MQRTNAELRSLVDCVQIVLTVGALVVLALPWWTYDASDGGHVRTGWFALSDDPYDQGWALIIVCALTLIATALRRGWAHWIGMVIALLGGLLIMIGVDHVQNFAAGDEYEGALPRAHAGAWLGGALALLAVVNQLAAVVVCRRSEKGRDASRPVRGER